MNNSLDLLLQLEILTLIYFLINNRNLNTMAQYEKSNI